MLSRRSLVRSSASHSLLLVDSESSRLRLLPGRHVLNQRKRVELIVEGMLKSRGWAYHTL